MKHKIISESKVQSMITFACPIANGNKTGKRFKIKEDFYDQYGHNIEHIEYKQGKIEKWEKFEYNDDGRLLEKIWYNCLGWDKSKFKSYSEKYSYDSNGQLITPNKTIIETDKDGNKVETMFFLNGKIKCKRIFSQTGVCIEELEYKSDKVSKRTSYNGKGSMISIHNFDAKGQPLNYSLFEYDDKGNQTRIKKVSRTGYVSQDRTLTYDMNNNLIEDKDTPKEAYKLHNDFHMNIIGPIDEEHSEGYRHV